MFSGAADDGPGCVPCGHAGEWPKNVPHCALDHERAQPHHDIVLVRAVGCLEWPRSSAYGYPDG